MRISDSLRRKSVLAIAFSLATVLSGCASNAQQQRLPAPSAYDYDYIIGPLDSLSIFVWRNPELSRSVTVRPDGKFSAPLVEDIVASGKTSTQLAREMELVLSTYVRDPLVTVMVGGFNGVFENQIRVVGEAADPRALPYQANITVLDVMISVGGVTEFAAGNKTTLVRTVNGRRSQMTVRLEDLLKDGDISANVKMAPGDILIIPEAWF